MSWWLLKVSQVIFMCSQACEPLNSENRERGEFPGCPVVRTWRFHCHGPGSIPDLGTKIPQAAQHGKIIIIKI